MCFPLGSLVRYSMTDSSTTTAFTAVLPQTKGLPSVPTQTSVSNATLGNQIAIGFVIAAIRK